MNITGSDETVFLLFIKVERERESADNDTTIEEEIIRITSRAGETSKQERGHSFLERERERNKGREIGRREGEVGEPKEMEIREEGNKRRESERELRESGRRGRRRRR